MAGIFGNQGINQFPGQGTQANMGWSLRQQPYYGYMSPDEIRFREYLASIRQPEDPAARARRMASEYAQYIKSIQGGAREGMPYSQYISQFAMTPQQWGMAEAQKNAPQTITLGPSKTTKIKSKYEDPIIKMQERTPSGAIVTRNVRLSEKMAGEELMSKQMGIVFTQTARENMDKFQRLVASDKEVQSNPEIAGQLGKAIEAISKGMSPENALALVKGAGKTPEVRAQRQQVAENARQEYRIKLASKQQEFRQENLDTQLQNAKELLNLKQKFQSAMEDARRDAQNARAEASNSIRKQELERSAEAKNQQMEMARSQMLEKFTMHRANLERTRYAINMEIANLGPEPEKNSTEYDIYQAKLNWLLPYKQEIESAIKAIKDLETSASKVPVKTKLIRIRIDDREFTINESELADIVDKANSMGKTVTVVGSGN